MNYKMVSKTVGRLLQAEALLLLLPMAVSIYFKENLIYVYGIVIAMLLCVGTIMTLPKPQTRKIYAREGFVIVSLSWILMSLFGALPFCLSGEIPNFVDALFEITSGFTTTGASILTDVEVLSRCHLYWRSFSHWVGGMGMLVFILAVIPQAKKTAGSGIHLMRAESPGPSVGKFTPHLRETALILYLLYVILTVICFSFLIFGGGASAARPKKQVASILS